MAQGLFNLKQVVQSLQQGAWNSQKPQTVEYLVVAGGGAGGGGYATGGGAGGLLAGSVPVPVGQTLKVTIGAGGTGVGNADGNTGNPSVFGQISASGGGYGVSGYGNRSGSGGSGGGSAGNTGKTLMGQGIAGQGNQGGNGGQETGSAQGGGGGAGTRGMDATGGNNGGAGGVGAASAITGTVTAYAGGGGGGVYGYASGDQGIGGAGGGGNAGAGGSSSSGSAGTANTGGGGGGSSYNPGAGGTVSGGNGGSGIVSISYPDTFAAAASTTGSPTVSTSGSGSIAFALASSQVVAFASNSAFQFGTGDFTWESWVYMSASGSYGFFDLGAINSAGSFGVFTSGSTIYVRIDSGNDLTYAAPGSFFGNWVHLAVVRSGSVMTLYYNGTSVAAGTRTNNLTQQTPYVGNLNGLNYYLNGNISNMRVVKGTAIYTGAFTPSTTPLTAVSGTSLLLNSVSGAYLANNATNGLAPTTGTTAPSWSSSSPFTVTGYKNRVYTWTSSGSITF